jgi:hypothetical protein
MWDFQTERKICSGDEICLETNDPQRLPLPDWRLLDMQWILHRVAAMSGAAESRDGFNEDDNDDDWEMAVGNEDLEMEDEWASSTPSRKSSTLPSSPPPCPLVFPSTDKVQLGTTATTISVDKSTVNSAGEGIDPQAKVEKDAPAEEGKGKRRTDLDTIAKFEEREAKKRMV